MSYLTLTVSFTLASNIECCCPLLFPSQEFLDPITKYNSLSGYLFNIQMLKQVCEEGGICVCVCVLCMYPVSVHVHSEHKCA